MGKGFFICLCFGVMVICVILTLFLNVGCKSIAIQRKSSFHEIDLMYNYGIEPKTLPEVLTDDAFLLPPSSSPAGIVQFAGKDLSKKDLSRLSLNFLSRLTFDQNTRWPHKVKLPPGFSAPKWLEIGKNPGLGIKALHSQGVTGKRISVAIFDKPILASHGEFKGRIVYQRIAPDVKKNHFLHFHGISCASILAGKTCGVAPEAKIYYFACPDAGRNFYYYSLAMDELMKVNESLPSDKKIRIVSISDGLSKTDKDWPMWEVAARRAQEKGIVVLYANVLDDFGFIWGGCPPHKNRNNPSGYNFALYLLARLAESKNPKDLEKYLYSSIIIPADYRTTASNIGKNVYIYWGSGGFSWAIPYIAGLAALAWDLKPDLTFNQIVDILESSKYVTKDGKRVINPQGFIQVVRLSIKDKKT
jgi:hypothetical protein